MDLTPFPKVWGYIGTITVFGAVFIGIINPALEKVSQTGDWIGTFVPALLTGLIAGLGALVNQFSHSATGTGGKTSTAGGGS